MQSADGRVRHVYDRKKSEITVLIAAAAAAFGCIWLGWEQPYGNCSSFDSEMHVSRPRTDMKFLVEAVLKTRR